MNEALKLIGDFIERVGFPVACVVASVWLVVRMVSASSRFLAPKIEEVVGAVVDFLKTTSTSVSTQTSILHEMAGEQRRQGSILTRMHRHFFNGEDHDESQEPGHTTGPPGTAG